MIPRGFVCTEGVTEKFFVDGQCYGNKASCEAAATRLNIERDNLCEEADSEAYCEKKTEGTIICEEGKDPPYYVIGCQGRTSTWDKVKKWIEY